MNLLNRQRIFNISFILILSALMTITVFAQEKTNERGYRAGNSHSISEIENVNLTNGNLMMNIPLAAVPGGRGGAPGYTVSLRYNGKLWDAKQERMDGGIASPNGPTQYMRNSLQPAGDGGWSINSSGYSLNLINRMDLEAEELCAQGNTGVVRNAFVYKVEMQTPDDGIINFRPFISNATFTDYDNDGYFPIDQNGVHHIVTYGSLGGENPQPSCGYQTQQITAAGMNYYSSDGSGIRLFIPYGSANNYKWKMYFPDGRIVENSPADDTTVFQRITDRNNNRLFFRAATVSGLTGTKIENEVGQWVFVSTQTNDVNKIIQPGFNGQLLETEVHWKSYRVHRKYMVSSDSNAPAYAQFTQWTWEFAQVDKITLPAAAGGLEYNFTYFASETMPPTGNYTTGWGELKSVTLPSGAIAEYDSNQEFFNNETQLASDVLKSGVKRKQLTYARQYDGGSQPVTETTYYNGNSLYGTTYGSTIRPDGGSYSESSGWGAQFHGYARRIKNPDNTIVEKIWANNVSPSVTGINTNAYVKTEFVSIPDASGNPVLTIIKDFDYDKNGNVLEVREYDWVAYNAVPRTTGAHVYPTGLPGGLVLKRKTVNAYYNPTPNAADTTTNSPNHYADPSSPKLKNVLKSTEIQNAAGTAVSRSEFYYDDPSNKGNLTETRTWDSTKQAALPAPDANGYRLSSSNSVTAFIEYDTYGNPTKTIDARGVESIVTYGSINTPSGTVTGLYPTQTETASNYSALKRTSTAAYDFHTGLVTSATDVDNNVTSGTEYDALGRPTKTKAAVGTPLEIWTQTVYDDVNRMVIVKSDVETKGDARKVGTQFYDQLGRVRLSKTLENSVTQSEINETDGIKVQTRYLTTNGYSYQLLSNPYRAATSTAATNEPEMGWTRSKTINTGKHSETETFTGATLPAPWGTNANSTGKMQNDTDANATTATDQTGKQRRLIANSLGQIIRVDEPDKVTGSLGSVSSPVQPTDYKYNTNGKMIEVTQGVQQRHFLYDSLGRLVRVRQPEQQINAALSLPNPEGNNAQWTVGFSYDANGNVLTTTDAKNVTTMNIYDALNRVMKRSYNDSVTPEVNFTYDDPNVPFSKGKLTRVSSTISETRYKIYDAAGRLVSSEQLTDNRIFPINYKYNLAGIMTEQTYPSGRTVKNFLETDGDLSAISSKVANGQFKTYASNFAYTASGVIKHLQIGSGLWESAKLNSRNQVTELNLGNSPTDGSLWKLNYDYGELNANGTVDATKNAGNIAKQTISFAGLAQPFAQTYKYDSLDRITEAREMSGANQTWIQTFGYDRYGNRAAFSQNTLGQQLQNNNQTLPAVDANTNKFQTGQGYSYDANGNLIQDFSGRQFTFDGDNKQTLVRDASNNVIGRYYYDGNGKRVKKVTNSETTIFVYDGAGKLVAEYSTAAPPTNPTTNYTATDPLGSPRIITNKQGQIVSRRDFMPFGEEITPDATYRTANLKYGAVDNVRQKFTGYQRDEETNLDFAEARYYNNLHGRFTAVDPLLASGKSANPQTFNRYAYTMNRPLNHIDPTGLQSGKIVVPTKAQDLASANTVGGKAGKFTGELIFSKEMMNLKQTILNLAYPKQAEIALINRSNTRYGDRNPEKAQDSVGSKTSTSKTDEKGTTVNVETSKNPLSVSSSSKESASQQNEQSGDSSVTSTITNTTEASKNLDIEIDREIGNFLNANADKDGNLTFDFKVNNAPEGENLTNTTWDRKGVEQHLKNYADQIKNMASCDYNPGVCSPQ